MNPVPTEAECAEIIGLGGRLVDYREVRNAGCAHIELVEVLRSGGNLYWYRWARSEGSTHAEVVEIIEAGGDLYWYRLARNAGVDHQQMVDAVRVHKLPPRLLDVFAKRMEVTPEADVATVVFETITGT